MKSGTGWRNRIAHLRRKSMTIIIIEIIELCLLAFIALMVYGIGEEITKKK